MTNKISKHTRNELIKALRKRYAKAPLEEKSRILDEFVAVAGYHRKHAVRLLGGQNQAESENQLPDGVFTTRL